MVAEDSIDNMVDEILTKSEGQKRNVEDVQVENDTTMPYRYITDEDEIRSILRPIGQRPMGNIMHVPKEAKMVDGIECLSGLGDTVTIENVIQRHIASRKFKD